MKYFVQYYVEGPVPGTRVEAVGGDSVLPLDGRVSLYTAGSRAEENARYLRGVGRRFIGYTIHRSSDNSFTNSRQVSGYQTTEYGRKAKEDAELKAGYAARRINPGSRTSTKHALIVYDSGRWRGISRKINRSRTSGLYGAATYYFTHAPYSVAFFDSLDAAIAVGRRFKDQPIDIVSGKAADVRARLNLRMGRREKFLDDIVSDHEPRRGNPSKHLTFREAADAGARYVVLRPWSSHDSGIHERTPVAKVANSDRSAIRFVQRQKNPKMFVVLMRKPGPSKVPVYVQVLA